MAFRTTARPGGRWGALPTWPLLVAAVLVAATVGFFAGALLDPRGETPTVVTPVEQRGTVLEFGARFGWDGGAFCIGYHHICIMEPAEGEEPIALYTFTTHDAMRARGCEARWEPTGTFGRGGGNVVTGIFVEPCGGARFDRSGQRLFGPAPRDLDRFPVTVTESGVTVDTRRLICGDTDAGRPAESCTRAPRPD